MVLHGALTLAWLDLCKRKQNDYVKVIINDVIMMKSTRRVSMITLKQLNEVVHNFSSKKGQT